MRVCTLAVTAGLLTGLMATPSLAVGIAAPTPAASIAGVAAVATSQVQQVRAGQHGAYQRVVLDLAGHRTVQLTPLGNGAWGVNVDAPLSPRARHQLGQLGRILPALAATVTDTSAEATQLTLSFNGGARLSRQFTLPAAGSLPTRVVFDFLPAGQTAAVAASRPAVASVMRPTPAGVIARTPVTPVAYGPLTATQAADQALPARARPSATQAIARVRMRAAPSVDDLAQALAALAPAAGGPAPARLTPRALTDDSVRHVAGVVPAAGAPAVVMASAGDASADAFADVFMASAAAPGLPVDLANPPPRPDAARRGGVTLSGFVEGEGRWFTQRSDDGVSRRLYGAVAAEPSLGVVWANGDQQLRLTGFGRLDTATDARTHADVREAKWVGVFGPLELTAGVDRKFWGVTEAVHLVNVLNQIDTLEDIDGEDYLGQPMVAGALTTAKLGTFSAYVMPYFRERRYPKRLDRPNGMLLVDRAQTRYESRHDDHHLDWAARWSLKAGPIDLGLSHFSGTGREPLLLPGLSATGTPVLIPYYQLIDQTGIDLQATFGAWLLKFEGIHQWNPVRDYAAFAAGFEYTLYGVTRGGADLGLLAEYLYDERGKSGTSPFDNDLFVGLRFAGNDIASTELLMGAVFDLENSSKAFNVEASRRLGSSWRISLDGRFFTSVAVNDPLRILRDDDFLQLKLQWYF